jgi:hypothetical protein
VLFRSCSFPSTRRFAPSHRLPVACFVRYHTTVVFNFSNEIGTFSNGSISLKRILNASRSPRANLHFFLKFGIRVKLETIELFRTKVYEYIKSKPREWLRPVAFRLDLIAADLGYSQYFILLNHRGACNFCESGKMYFMIQAFYVVLLSQNHRAME